MYFGAAAGLEEYEQIEVDMFRMTALYILERLLHVTRTTAFTHHLAEALILPPAASPGKRRRPPVASEPLSERLQNGELASSLLGLGETEEEDEAQEPQV